jgi:hypothetical protein
LGRAGCIRDDVPDIDQERDKASAQDLTAERAEIAEFLRD